MTIYAAIELTNPRLLLVTDESAEAYKKIEEAKSLDGSGEAQYMVLQSDSLRLSPSATACVSMENGIAGVEESVLARMKEQNLDETSFPGNFKQIAFEIADSAFFNMMSCGVCEKDAIDMALKEKGLLKNEPFCTI